MTRENGEIVRLAWKQVATLLFAAIMPALTFGGALWYWAERVVVVEAVQGYHTTYIERLDNRVTQMEARDGSSERDASGRRAGEVTLSELVVERPHAH